MKCLPYLIAILACLGVCTIYLIMMPIIKHRKKICRWWKRHAISMFIVSILMPFLIPIIMAVVPLIFNENGCSCVGCSGSNGSSATVFILVLALLAFINAIFHSILWIKDKKEIDVRWENASIKHAFDNMFKAHMCKNTQLRSSYHGGLTNGILTDADIPYNIFDQIREISWDFCHTISGITGISIQDLSASFIYHYNYENANENDRKWRWITGKGSKFSMPLTDFIEESDSTFHYMIHNSVSTVFYNDKEKAMRDKKYQFSYRDHSHNLIGSFVAAKVAFSGNDGKLCEGIIMVTSYGKRFLDNDKVHTEEELSHLILDDIFPCFRHLFTTELAMLYFRHQDEPIENAQPQNSKGKKKKFRLTLVPEDFHLHKKSVKSIITATKKLWHKK